MSRHSTVTEVKTTNDWYVIEMNPVGRGRALCRAMWLACVTCSNRNHHSGCGSPQRAPSQWRIGSVYPGVVSARHASSAINKGSRSEAVNVLVDNKTGRRPISTGAIINVITF